MSVPESEETSSKQGPLGGTCDSVTIPFQFHLLDIFGDETTNSTCVPNTNAAIIKHTKYFQNAQFKKLEAVVFPSAPSLKYPVSFDICWTTCDVNPSGDNVLAVPTSLRFTVGGLNLQSSPVYPADFNLINPEIKSSIPYTNLPRLCIHHRANPDCKETGSDRTIKASVYVRGLIRLCNPIVTV